MFKEVHCCLSFSEARPRMQGAATFLTPRENLPSDLAETLVEVTQPLQTFDMNHPA